MVATKVLHENLKCRHSLAKDDVMDQDLFSSPKIAFYYNFSKNKSRPVELNPACMLKIS